jgi:hypothetical protein
MPPSSSVPLQGALYLGGPGAEVEFPFRRPVAATEIQNADARRVVAALAQAESVSTGPLLAVQTDGTVRAEAALVELALPPTADAETRARHVLFLSGERGA